MEQIRQPLAKTLTENKAELALRERQVERLGDENGNRKMRRRAARLERKRDRTSC